MTLQTRDLYTSTYFLKGNEMAPVTTAPHPPPPQKMILNYSPYLGCDPEFFFERGGKVIGAEKVLDPAKKIMSSNFRFDGASTTTSEHFVLDGVQVELNPRPNTCRANLGNEIACAFRALRVHLESMGDVRASFKTVVEVSKDELDSLSDKAKVFGCAESLNTYDASATVGVDATTYLKRSAGGHIHLGLTGGALMAARASLVPVLDVLLGNTCVLIDRDPEQAERRKVYGRAGEHRLPKHGLEYRTLSNFWLRAYPLMSMVMGISRQATSILYTATVASVAYKPLRWEADKELLSRVDLAKVREAINTNNFDLAMENWQGVKGFINDYFPYTTTGLNSNNLPDFEYFVEKVRKGGIEAYFPEDPLTHWCAITDGHNRGWESFLGQVASERRQMAANMKLEALNGGRG